MKIWQFLFQKFFIWFKKKVNEEGVKVTSPIRPLAQSDRKWKKNKNFHLKNEVEDEKSARLLARSGSV